MGDVNIKTIVAFPMTSLYKLRSKSGEPITFAQADSATWTHTRRLIRTEDRDGVELELAAKSDRILSRVGLPGLGHSKENFRRAFTEFGGMPMSSDNCMLFLSHPVTRLYLAPPGEAVLGDVVAVCSMWVVSQWPASGTERAGELLADMAREEGLDVPGEILSVFTLREHLKSRLVVAARLEDGLSMFGVGWSPVTGIPVTEHRQVVPKFVGIRNVGLFTLPIRHRERELFNAAPARVALCIPGISSERIPHGTTISSWSGEMSGRVALAVLGAER